ncbi:hypothetical protein AMK27_36010 [Streptomyces sp. CB02009]|uniref:hypothetical protein n=1 Tax=Streptomyces sp. CB02009 TaxID=1703938 RepID=UPI000938D7D3|nr:hypothetical protein [Streptomyces sp. CB02009]OKJ49483.1 hypothetical protein AMK27_36010 [Streptomyces sp. CB02009]
MSEWEIALIAAGAAILGSITTGFFTWRASHRQTSALISTVQATFLEQRRVRTEERRRAVYGDLLTAGQAWELGATDGEARTLRAFHLVELEGPDFVASAALDYASADPGDESAPAREKYLKAVRRALNET